jgi:serine protease Do
MQISAISSKLKKITITSIAIAFCFFAQEGFAVQNSGNSIADVVEKLSPAVVNISTTQLLENGNKDAMVQEIPEEFFKFFEEFKNGKGGFDNKPAKVISLGSGFFIDSKGHIVTNYHVIDNAEEINITIGDNEGKIYKAKVIGKDQKTDLALLKIDTKESIPFVVFGNSDEVRVGESVIAIGNAFGFGGTVTTGIISAKGRHLEGQNYEDFIQTDASINRGNSGGALFNMNGEVIGVNSAIVSPNGGNIGIGFAIPSNVAKLIVDQLMKGGRVERGWLGITFQPVTEEIAKGFSLDSGTQGAIVSNAIKEGPAEKAGIKTSDIIIKFNGIPINKANQFPKIVSNSPMNKKLPMEIIRKGKIVTLYVTLELPKSDDPFGQKEKELVVGATYHGISVANITKEVSKYYNIDDVTGVIVTKLDQNSNAYKSGLREGDVIIEINQNTITSAKQFRTVLTNIKLKSPKNQATATFLIERKKSNFFVSIQLD